MPGDDAELVRCIVDSMALAIAETLEEALSNWPGTAWTSSTSSGAAWPTKLLLGFIAATTGLDVVAGPVEASAIGNLLVQLRAADRVGDRREMRALVSRSFPTHRYRPDPSLRHAAQAARGRLSELAAR